MAATDRGAFAELLRQPREAAAPSQQELAARSWLSRRRISDLERRPGHWAADGR
jgi:transcriptional regulator with XRE-family HTH domain